jgi:hypothetical protein
LTFRTGRLEDLSLRGASGFFESTDWRFLDELKHELTREFTLPENVCS